MCPQSQEAADIRPSDAGRPAKPRTQRPAPAPDFPADVPSAARAGAAGLGPLRPPQGAGQVAAVEPSRGGTGCSAAETWPGLGPRREARLWRLGCDDVRI